MLPYRLRKHHLSPGAEVALHVQAKSVYLGFQLRRGKAISLLLWFNCSLAWSSKVGLHLGTSNPWVVIAAFHCGAAPEGGNIEPGKDVFPLPGCMASRKNNKCQGFQQGQTYKEKCPRSKVEPSGRLAPLRTANHMHVYPCVCGLKREQGKETETHFYVIYLNQKLIGTKYYSKSNNLKYTVAMLVR